MRLQARRRNTFALGFIAAIAISTAPTPVEAQWGFGMGGWGWGWGGFNQVPKPETYIYQKSLVDAGPCDPEAFARRLCEQSELLHQPSSRQRFCRALQHRQTRAFPLSNRRTKNFANGAQRFSTNAGIATRQFLQSDGQNCLAWRRTDGWRLE